MMPLTSKAWYFLPTDTPIDSSSSDLPYVYKLRN